jgi:hypothetical protein
MADRSHIPNSPACGHWETLLADALDGLLKPEDEATFSSHMAACAACTALFEEARRGREWLEFLSPEPEVPAGLLDKILASTGPGQVAGFGLVTSNNDVVATIQPWQKPGFMARIRRFAEPRLMMTAAMAFFSITLTLNLTGVRLTDFRLADLRPSMMRSYMERQFTMASTPIIRYYDHLRLVYEVQARVRELRRNSEGENTDNPQQQNNRQPVNPGESKQSAPHKDGGSRVNPPQQSGVPTNIEPSDDLETAFNPLEDRPAHLGGSLLQLSAIAAGDPGSTMAVRERSTVWIA